MKEKKLIEKLKIVLAFILGIIISGSGVYAATILFNSNIVSYDNTSSGLTSTNVQAAIDELYAKTKPQYYAFGNYYGWCPSNDTNCYSYEQFPITSTTPPSGKNVYAAKYADGGYGICMKRNGSEHCFRGRNWIAEKEHIKKVFSDISCTVYSSSVRCDASDFHCVVNSGGRVDCNDHATSEYCYVYMDGYVFCS